MTIAWVRRSYGVPAKVGGRVRYTGEGRDEFGTITGVSGGHLSIRLDGCRHAMPFHPTWKLEYLGVEAASPSERLVLARDEDLHNPISKDRRGMASRTMSGGTPTAKSESPSPTVKGDCDVG